MEFLSLSRRSSSARNVPSDEERGGTDVSQANLHLEKEGCHYLYIIPDVLSQPSKVLSSPPGFQIQIS